MILDDEGRPMIPVYVCWNDHEAELVASVLREYSIVSRLNSEVPHSIWPITADGLGKVEVLVREGHAHRAGEILQDHGMIRQ